MRIEIIPIGQIDRSVLEYLVGLLAERFTTSVEVGSSVPIEIFRINELRRQYLSTSMLQTMRTLRGSNRRVLLAVVDADLYVPSLNFVFGEADPTNRMAIISLSRLRPTPYDSQNDQDLLKRAGKEAVHELGHVFHLKHCIRPICVMFFSNSLADTDFKKDEFCDNCRSMLTFYADSAKS